ncbi:hypothetical protein PV10_08086 [Exophiala mesophila]|uniref:Actin interacting protein 3 C-terminal domain-containing protein n=1 Tax=Exophiala mesophila TaxID=212818 RepID=A0A0D1WHV6_EXOME|nr:uncharacterized protein PV10_08086 [Exophiala mesophila]KIV88400.1 hypothetical protein PV10_08086 [Exophiala mesophila]
MQAPASTLSQRQIPSQRRPANLPETMQSQPQNTSGPPPGASGSQGRSASGSARSRSTNPDKQISQIEKSVTHLLVATKQLLETLTQWSRGQAQEEEVSDVYVRLGYEFNLACRAFNSIGVDTSDLGPVPDLLRSILEDTLSQTASTQALDNYLPRIRDIIINLLHGLKRKQSRLRGRAPKDAGPVQQPRVPPQNRQASISTVGSNETGLTHMLDDVPSNTSSLRMPTDTAFPADQSQQPSATSNTSPFNPSNRPSINRHSVRRDVAAPIPLSESSSTMSPNSSQNIPSLPPYHDVDDDLSSSPAIPTTAFPHPPPPPPKQTDALARLQRGGDLERRASRRFSAYQIQKHLGTSPNGVPMMPSTQNSPAPNRGLEARESLNAVRLRTSYQQGKARTRIAESPSRSGTMRAPQRISEERDESPVLTLEPVAPIKSLEEPLPMDSPTAKTPEEYHKPPNPVLTNTSGFFVGPTVNGPLSAGPVASNDSLPSASTDIPALPKPPISEEVASEETPETIQRKALGQTTPTQSRVLTLDSSPPQTKELTLFLQYRTRIKKFVLPDGYEELTLPRLQLAFIEKFAWTTQHNGADLPEIYVQDPVSGVRHELEDLSDVKDRCVLVLNVEELDEVKKHIDEGIGGLSKALDGVKQLLEGQGTLMQRFADRQLETSKEVARMSAVPSIHPSRTPTLSQANFKSSTSSESSVLEIQSLRREIAVLRQTYSTMSADFAASMNDIRTKAAAVKATAADAANSSYKGDAGRAHINEGKKTLSNDSEALVNRVDDLSDLVEELRKDVVTRGVRPLPRQLETISKDISATAKQLLKVKDFVKREKPVWTKIWEQELQVVMLERDDLTQQDELLHDLDGDLDDITNVFKLVEEAMKQQNLQAANNIGRNLSRNLAIDIAADPHEAKTGMLDEVRALQPNHENRLEAIQRAEKARQKELASRKVGEFQREVEQFVEEGKLKKTGGMDEVERRRKMKDEQARKENHERQLARALEMEKRKAEKEAAKAAAAAAAASDATNSAPPESSPAEMNGNAHDEGQENGISQEVETPFEDAREEKIISPPNEAIESAAALASQAKDTPQSEEPPQLPKVDVGEELDNDKGLDAASPAPDKGKSTPDDSEHDKAKDNRGSWWQPAIFSA